MKNTISILRTTGWFVKPAFIALFIGFMNAPAFAQWTTSGDNIYYNKGNVSIGTTTMVGASSFVVKSKNTSGYGGMAVQIDGTGTNLLPFYSYATNGTVRAWHYFDENDDTWKLYNGGIKLVVKNDGNVGIGTVSPLAKLEIISNTTNAGDNTARFRAPAIGPHASHIHWGTTGDWYIRSAADNGKVVIQDNGGNVGIGTSAPDRKLHVKGYAKIEPWTSGGSYAEFSSINGGKVQLYLHDGSALKVAIRSDGTSYFNGGNVAIGTTNPGSYQLAVEGKIGAREIEVKLGAWADYVFDKDYELKPLDEVASFIQDNKHLPDVPSEKEVLENGVSLGEMNKILLQKVEELTLYMIDLKKQNDNLQEKINAMEQR